MVAATKRIKKIRRQKLTFLKIKQFWPVAAAAAAVAATRKIKHQKLIFLKIRQS